RANKNLFSGPNVVRGRVIGADPDGAKRDRATRVSKHMSYQVLEQMPEWEEDMDRLLLVLPICGVAYKKTYFNGTRNVSELVLPQDLIVNYYATSFEGAPRKTHVLTIFPNTYESRVRRGMYRAVDLG